MWPRVLPHEHLRGKLGKASLGSPCRLTARQTRLRPGAQDSSSDTSTAPLPRGFHACRSPRTLLRECVSNRVTCGSRVTRRHQTHTESPAGLLPWPDRERTCSADSVGGCPPSCPSSQWRKGKDSRLTEPSTPALPVTPGKAGLEETAGVGRGRAARFLC